ncbi:Protein kinase domain/Protein tyrosine kinase, putative [Leishmania lindenbergi]|uniref:Protein kinase domain-containing protein n=1 Tax=Leishmania lindenbergi TaxID=651832 RepID=A0AAW3ASS1_9TRYP
MHVSFSPAHTAADEPYANGTSSSPSLPPSMRIVVVAAAAAAAAALLTVPATSVTQYDAAAHAVTSNGDGGSSGSHTLTNTGVGIVDVLLVVACTLMLVTIALLIVVIRLLKHVAAAATALGSSAPDIRRNDLRAEVPVAYRSVGLDDDENNNAALHGNNRDSRTQRVEYAEEQQSLRHRARSRGGRTERHHHRSTSPRHQETGQNTILGLFDALSVRLGLSPTAAIEDATSCGKTAAPRSRSRSYRAVDSAVPSLGSCSAARGSPELQCHASLCTDPDAFATGKDETDAFRAAPQSTWHNSSSLNQSGAARKREESAVAQVPPSSEPSLPPAVVAAETSNERKTATPAAANHGGTSPSDDAQMPVFTATTQKDMAVYNTTRHSRYRLLQRIGLGAFSSVYLVQHKDTGKKYALKYILCKGDRERRAALRECEAINCLQGHPQVIRLVEMFMNYQFQSAPTSPRAAGSPAIPATLSGRREQATGEQSLRPRSTAQPRAPAAIAPSVSPAAAQSLWSRPSSSAAPSHGEATAITAVANAHSRHRAPAPAASAGTTTMLVAARLKELSDADMAKSASLTRFDGVEVTATPQAPIRAVAMERSTEHHPAAHDEEEDDNVDYSHVDTAAEDECQLQGALSYRYRSPRSTAARGYGSGNGDEDDEGCRRVIHGVRPSVKEVAYGTYMADADHASDMRGVVSTFGDRLASIEARDGEEPPQLIFSAADREQQHPQQPQPQGKQSMRTSSSHDRCPLHSVQRTSQSGNNGHLHGADAATSTTPKADSSSSVFAGSAHALAPPYAAAGGGARGYGHAPLQSASHSLREAFPTASTATRTASTDASLPARSEAHAGQSRSCGHATGAPGAVVDNASDPTATIDVSVGCCTVEGMAITATTTHNCLPSTACNATLSRSSGASDEHGTLEYCDGGHGMRSSSGSTRRGKKIQSATREVPEPTSQSSRVSLKDFDVDGVDDGRANAHVGSEKRRTDRRRDADAEETRSCKRDDACSSATSSSGTQEEPIQPIHRILMPLQSLHQPPNGLTGAPSSGDSKGAALQLQNRTCTPGTGNLTAYNLYSNSPTATAGEAPGVVKPMQATGSAEIPLSVAANLHDMGGSTVSTFTPPPQQQQQLLPSLAASYALARTAVSSADVSSAASGTLTLQAPIRYKDFVPPHTLITAPPSASRTPVTAMRGNGGVIANSAVEVQEHRQPINRGGRLAPPLYGIPARAGSGTTITGTCGLRPDRLAGAYGNPYLERASGGEPVPPPRTSYAPGGGVRYNSLIVPYVAAPTKSQTAAKGLPAQSSSASSPLMLSASGTGVSAFDERNTGRGQGWHSEVTGAASISQDSYASMSACHTACLEAPRPLPSAAPVAATVVRSTYAPLRHGDVAHPTAASPAASSMTRSSTATLSPPSTPRQQQQQQLPSAAYPAASLIANNGRLSLTAVIQAPHGGQQGKCMDCDDSKPRANVSSSATDSALMSAHAPPPPPPLRSLVSQVSSAYLLREAGGLNGAGVAPSRVRYTNAGNPIPWDAYNANTTTVDAAAAVAVLAGLSPKVDGRAPTVTCTGAGDTRDSKSCTTTRTSCSHISLQDARNTGYLGLVIEYHPMGDLCRYALRAKQQLEMRCHRQQQSQRRTLGRSGVVSMATPRSTASLVTATVDTRTRTTERSSTLQPQPTARNATERDDGGTGANAVEPISPFSCRPSVLTHGGTAAASSLLAAAAAATWTAKVAMSRTDLPLALSAGVGSGGTNGNEHLGDFDNQSTAAVATDPTSDNPLTEAQLLSIAYQLASVLDHMHRQNPPIIHRDLKPENILIKGELSDYLDVSLSAALASTSSTPSSPVPLTNAGGASSQYDTGECSAVCVGGNNDGLNKSSVSPQSPSFASLAAVIEDAANSSWLLPPIRITRAVVPIALIDFGLAIMQDTHSRPHSGRGGGTRPYIAPESWHGGTCTASDVWSLGCVLYALATCRLVAKDVRIMSQEAKQDGFASRMLNDIIEKKYSLAFASFVVSLLVVDPAKRPTAAQAAQCFCIVDDEIRFDLRSPFFSNVLDL